ncbi:protein BREAST CANCER SUSCEPTIBILITY 2 homolog B-like isoform X2 [Momordica charantia]|uniref:Protein BREAST CANCER SUSCEPTIBILITY 2 homolog B-like isoform X2 n=1 Tax=Momordica charantia TaxID=3673 RepID=A0A6J1DYC6_MOMCH|nr:protein BREAST CANCER SUSCEPTIBILITY 2 homolog B-like isoform X2 [Momordica charantia]
MSSWQIFSDAGNHFRWEVSDERLEVKSECEQNDSLSRSSSSSIHRLPSMADLLLCSRLLEKPEDSARGAPMFRTGLGKSVPVKQSSIEKALSLLGDENAPDLVHAGPLQNGGKFSNSLFQTGSGKSVNVSSEGLLRAKTLLGLEEDDSCSNFQSLGQAISPYDMKGPFLESKGVCGMEEMGDESVPISPLVSNTGFSRISLENHASPSFRQIEFPNKAPKPPPIKFHTAGGRSLSVSSDALQRARSLLGDPELGSFLDEGDMDCPTFTVRKENIRNAMPSNGKYTFHTPSFNKEEPTTKHTSKSFSPLRSSSSVVQSSFQSKNILGSNLIKKFDAVEHESSCGFDDKISCLPENLGSQHSEPSTLVENATGNGIKSGIHLGGRSFGGPLNDISNVVDTRIRNDRANNKEKRKLWGTNSVSPFKRPRNSKFSTPLNKNVPLVTTSLSTSSSNNFCCKRTVSTRYPYQASRMYIKEYFGRPPSNQDNLDYFSEDVRRINAENAGKYKVLDNSGTNYIGVEAFRHMLADSGASLQHASELWVPNHYKWIVWKLACYERQNPVKSNGKFLTVSNVLEELKYRYEREVNQGHRSAIKRILEGDTPPSMMLVLCVSAIRLNYKSRAQACSSMMSGSDHGEGAKIELTDGWYSIDALLDGPLSKQLVTGKLFVGQKLRIWGARLCGWVGPVSPLEISSTVYLSLHINGTFRAHWADRLGFCKNGGVPLSFKCIKSSGGPVPWTLVGVSRKYPVLYKDRLGDGASIVRNEKMEMKTRQLYDQRRTAVIDGIVSEFQRGIKSSIYNENDSEEGAKIFKILETAAEPEVLMAEMSPEQLTSFATYQAKMEAIQQSDMEKSIEKALSDAGLNGRDVTPFMRVRVVGLISKNNKRKSHRKEGLITIWNPTEKQQLELVEGQAYAIAGLVPINCDADILYLQAKGSNTKWQSLSPQAMEYFEPFYRPRKSVSISNLGEVPLSSEFDVVAMVIHVGEVFTTAHQKKQWIFVADGSIFESHSGLSNSLLAISFCSPYVGDESFVPMNCNLVGSTAFVIL